MGANRAHRRNPVERALVLAREGAENPTAGSGVLYPSAFYRDARRATMPYDEGARVMFATGRGREPGRAEADRFLSELEQEFDLMRLRARRALLEREEARLAGEQGSLREDVRRSASRPGRPSEVPAGNGRTRGRWSALASRVAMWRMGVRRKMLAEEARRLALLEGDIEFALRLGRRRSR